MAASQAKSVGGYHCEFIDPVSDDFICNVCNCVAREPNLTVCCGQHYCQSCIMKIVEDGRPCPNPECGEAMFNAVLNKNCKRKILSLRVHCTMKDRGCQWTGKVEQLDTHLDVNSGDCQYVDVECPEKCGQQVQKHQLATHITNNCPKRVFACMYCGLKATYEVVSEHWLECQNYLVPCPNRCQIGEVERNTLEDHLNMCSLEVVECDFSYAGCNEKLQRQDMEKHIEENTQKHLALMASVSMKMSREFEQKERETAEQFKEKDKQIKGVEERLQQLVREKEEQIESLQKSLQREQKEGEQQLQQQLEQKERQIKHVQESLQEQLQEKDNQVQGELRGKQKQIEALKEQIVQVKQDHEEQIKAVEQRKEEQIKSLEVQSQQQVERIGKLEKQLKEKEQELEQVNMKLGMPLHFTIYVPHFQLNSPPMYTHPHGYKFYIQVPKYGTHVRVLLYSMPGEFDATLQWPTKFTITLQLLNQHRDQDHITVTKQFQWKKPEEKVSVGYFAGSARSAGSGGEYVASFTETLIALTDLQRNAEKQTQYLKDDCLHFRITKIEVQKQLENTLHFTMSNFNQLKTKDTYWYSPPMYTHPHGYKFYIGVRPNGEYGGYGTHVSVWLCSMPGESDATLQWPAKFTISLQLLNQHRDQDHITVTKQCQWEKPEKEGKCVASFTHTLIAHTDLQLNAQTQYLKDDCLHFRITKTEVQK